MNTKRNDVKNFFSGKSFIFGLLIGIIAAIGITNVFASEKIKSAKYEEIKVYLNNSVIPLENSLVSIVESGENDAKVYMPLRESLEYMGYNVEWNDSEQSINISKSSVSASSVENTKTENTLDNNIDNSIDTSDLMDGNGVSNIQTHDTPDMDTVISKRISQIDKRALKMMYCTGNWITVQTLLPYMTSEGLQVLVDLYMQKGGNSKNAEVAVQYIDKNKSVEEGSSQTEREYDYDVFAQETMAVRGNIYDVIGYLPYMTTKKIDTMVKEYIDKTNKFGCIYNFISYMSQDGVDTVVKNYIDKTNDFNCIYDTHQFMSVKGIDDIVKSYIDRTGDYGSVTDILEFMSKDASDYIARKYINESGDKQYGEFFTPYLKN